jgi:MoaA/NifB/PqqE/SkfB family radical SAM enzyme
MNGVLDKGLDKLRLRRAPGRPDQVHLAVTDRCFLPCLHCDIWKSKTPDLGTEVWEEVLARGNELCGG